MQLHDPSAALFSATSQADSGDCAEYRPLLPGPSRSRNRRRPGARRSAAPYVAPAQKPMALQRLLDSENPTRRWCLRTLRSGHPVEPQCARVPAERCTRYASTAAGCVDERSGCDVGPSGRTDGQRSPDIGSSSHVFNYAVPSAPYLRASTRPGPAGRPEWMAARGGARDTGCFAPSRIHEAEDRGLSTADSCRSPRQTPRAHTSVVAGVPARRGPR